MRKSKPYHPDFDAKADPLVRACLEGDLKKARALIKEGAPVNAIGSKRWGYYPIHAAAERGYDKVVRYLLRMGAKVDPRTAADIEQREDTPLLLAAAKHHLKTVQILVEGGADINAHSLQKNTALGRAIQRCNRELFDYLLANGARAESADLRLAAGNGCIEIMQYFLSHGFSITDGDDERYGTLLYCAIARNQMQMVKLLIERGADINKPSEAFAETPLIQATGGGKWEIANYLLEKGADPNLSSKYKAYPLNYTVRRGAYQTAQYGLLNHGGHETARRLIVAGARLDSVDFEGMTPLEWAVDMEDKEMFLILVKSGARVPKKLVSRISRRFGKASLAGAVTK